MSSQSLDATIATLNLSMERLKLVKLQILELKKASPYNRQLAITNALSLARSVYHSLSQLRKQGNVESKAWFKLENEKLATSEINDWLRKARDVSLKEAKPITSMNAYIGNFNTDMMANLVRPPGATSFFIGDQNGGSGWDITHSDGSTSVVYVNSDKDIPEARIIVWNSSQFAPKGKEQTPVEELFEQYTDEYNKILLDGIKRFSGGPVG
jgi:hypothetical protein